MSSFLFCLNNLFMLLFTPFSVTLPKFISDYLGNGISACMSRDFGIFMPKHLAG
jgi:hypothetical protein